MPWRTVHVVPTRVYRFRVVLSTAAQNGYFGFQWLEQSNSPVAYGMNGSHLEASHLARARWRRSAMTTTTDPTGKSLPQSAERAVQPFVQKYFGFSETQIRRIIRLSHPTRGAARDRHETRGGMRWTLNARETNAREADGEDVWFRRRDAGVKSCGAIRMATVATKPVHRGERVISRKTIAQGKPGCLR